MPDNQQEEVNRRRKHAAGGFTGDQIAQNESQADRAKSMVKDNGNNLVDTLPGRGTE